MLKSFLKLGVVSLKNSETSLVVELNVRSYKNNMLAFLISPDIDLSSAIILVGTSAATSFLSAATGIGGGMVLLAVMASFVPAAIIIPVHGLVQIGSNAGRMFLMVKHVQWSILMPFLFGSTLGAATGGITSIQLSPQVLEVGLAIFILWMVWGTPITASGRFAIFGTGIFSSFLTMFFGATGVFISAMIKTLNLGRLEHVATHSTFMLAQHLIKVSVFGILGFSFAPYVGLIAAMVISGFLGTILGKRFLLKINDKFFHLCLSILLSLLAMRLLFRSIFFYF